MLEIFRQGKIYGTQLYVLLFPCSTHSSGNGRSCPKPLFSVSFLLLKAPCLAHATRDAAGGETQKTAASGLGHRKVTIPISWGKCDLLNCCTLRAVLYSTVLVTKCR
jgi:hypothetical protein